MDPCDLDAAKSDKVERISHQPVILMVASLMLTDNTMVVNDLMFLMQQVHHHGAHQSIRDK